MICEVLGAVECLAICVINMAADVLSPAGMVGAIWLMGLAGMTLVSRRSA